MALLACIVLPNHRRIARSKTCEYDSSCQVEVEVEIHTCSCAAKRCRRRMKYMMPANAQRWTADLVCHYLYSYFITLLHCSFNSNTCLVFVCAKYTR